MKKIKISMFINILIVLFVIIGNITMFNGIRFMRDVTLLELTGIQMFKFYTVDSNILMGIVAFIFLIFEFRLLNKNIKIPNKIYTLKYIGTSAITITFIVTLFFLAPKYGFYAMYNNTNLFFHMIIPVLSIITFVLFEKYDTNYKTAIFGIIPMIFYAIYYSSRIMIHLDDGGLSFRYDFYGFLFGNINNIFIVLPVIFLISYLISLGLLFLNKRIKI